MQLNQVSGPVVAHAHAGDLVATFAAISDDRPMAFSSWAGKVDVTFPGDVAARLKMRTDHGQILSDFDLGKTETALEDMGDGRRQKMRSFTYATVNGGGTEYMFQNYSGDIIIRRK